MKIDYLIILLHRNLRHNANIVFGIFNKAFRISNMVLENITLQTKINKVILQNNYEKNVIISRVMMSSRKLHIQHYTHHLINDYNFYNQSYLFKICHIFDSCHVNI